MVGPASSPDSGGKGRPWPERYPPSTSADRKRTVAVSGQVGPRRNRVGVPAATGLPLVSAGGRLDVSDRPGRTSTRQGLTRPLASKAAYTSGMSLAKCASIASATISISRCGYDGNREPSRRVRRLKKAISERALQVAYIAEYVATGSTPRATSRATPAASISRYCL